MSDYIQSIADVYLEQTGKIHIYPNEFVIIAKWEKEQIPLFVVLPCIEEISERYRRKRIKIRGIALFEEEVSARHLEWLEGQVGR